MGIKGLFKWLEKQFPLCITNKKYSYAHCNTLFIDLCQLCLVSLGIVEKKMSDLSEEQQMQNYLDISIKKVKNTILTINPHDTIFAFFDGSCPAIKFQRKRERYFENEYVENYVIDPTEYTLGDVNKCRDRLIVQKLFEYFTEFTSNCVYLRANEILFSTFFSQGEAEHKFFEVFRSLKKEKKLKANQLHSIFSFDNDLIILALQFYDEHFIVMKNFDTIIDISILRDLFVYQMIQKDLFFVEENSEKNFEDSQNLLQVVREFLSKVPLKLKQQIIDDIMAMSFILGSDYLPQIPDLEGMSFSKLLNSYKKINENYFLSVISGNANEDTEIAFFPLIVKDCFCVPSLQKLIRECFRDSRSNESNNDSSNDNNNSNNNNNSSNDSNNNNNNNNSSNDNNNNNKNNNSSNDNNNNNNNNNSSNDNNDNNNNNYNDSNNVNSNSDDAPDYLSNIDEASQHMLRVFNFIWLYYMRECPSWTYYYPFKYAPPISEAVGRMHQEGPEVFSTPGSKVKTDNLFKTFVNHSVQYKENLPWCLYKLKIPPSEISHFWPLGVKEAKDVPMMNLEVMRDFFEKEKKNVSKEDLEYTGYTDNLFYTFYNQKRNRGRNQNNSNQQFQKKINQEHQYIIQQQLNQQMQQHKQHQQQQQSQQQQQTQQQQQQQQNQQSQQSQQSQQQQQQNQQSQQSQQSQQQQQTQQNQQVQQHRRNHKRRHPSNNKFHYSYS